MKRNKGQSLLEFTLVAPILLLVLITISELGYAFVVRQNIIDAVKQVVQSSNFHTGKYATDAEYIAAMKKDMEDFISTHNLPAADKLEFGVGTSNKYGTAVIISYTYKPAYRLIGITPEKITIQSSQILQPGMMKANLATPTVPFVPSI